MTSLINSCVSRVEVPLIVFMDVILKYPSGDVVIIGVEDDASVQFSVNSILAEQPSSRPNGKGTSILPQYREHVTFRPAVGLYPVFFFFTNGV